MLVRQFVTLPFPSCIAHTQRLYSIHKILGAPANFRQCFNFSWINHFYMKSIFSLRLDFTPISLSLYFGLSLFFFSIVHAHGSVLQYFIMCEFFRIPQKIFQQLGREFVRTEEAVGINIEALFKYTNPIRISLQAGNRTDCTPFALPWKSDL